MNVAPVTTAPPRFSVDERDRRWRLVREAMEASGLDCLVASSELSGDPAASAAARYLTDCGAGAPTTVLFPRNGEVAFFATNADRARSPQTWVSDVQPAATDQPARRVAHILTDLDLTRGRIGLVGLDRMATAGDDALQALTTTLPRVAWTDFTHPLEAIAAVKSDEEVAVLSQSVAVVERAIHHVETTAHAGVRDHEVWGGAVAELCRGGSELPVEILWGSGLRPALLRHPPHSVLHRGYLILASIEAAFGGYRARGMQAIALEECDPVYKDLYQIQGEYWVRCFETLQAGRTVAEVRAQCEAHATAILPEGSRYGKPAGQVILRESGLAWADASAGELGDDDVLLPGRTVTLTVRLQIEAARREYRALWGDTMVMTERGGRRLGARPPGLILTQAP